MINYKIHKLDLTDSTNSFLKGKIAKGQASEGTIVTAKGQSAGKGYGENIWESEHGKNLLLSLMLEPAFLAPSEQFYISMVTSIAVFETVYDFIFQNYITIKWPNDIYYKKKKIAGILIENTIAGNKLQNSIIGVGINVNQKEFPAHLPNPVSIVNITEREFDTDEVLEEFMKRMDIWYGKLKNNKKDVIKDTYLNSLFMIDTTTKFKANGEIFNGKIRDIDDFGRIVIESKKQMLTFGFKEIEYIL
jgi:BirA family biotin operon repressor/biotin-[acetyl-CoA-carboxylase] ligase